MTTTTDLPPPPKPAPLGLVLAKQLTAPHFWMSVITLLMHAAQKAGWLAPAWETFFNEIKVELVGVIVFLAALWTAPRTQWTRENQVQNAAKIMKDEGYGIIPPTKAEDTPLPPPVPPRPDSE